jgi:hypothetical protein
VAQLRGGGADDSRLTEDRRSVGRRLLDRAVVADLRAYLKGGIPQALRGRVWMALLGVDVTSRVGDLGNSSEMAGPRVPEFIEGRRIHVRYR